MAGPAHITRRAPRGIAPAEKPANLRDYPTAWPVSERARAAIERQIEQLIAVLDALDPDPDLEPDADNEDGGDLEPSIGGDVYGIFGTDFELDESDLEPSLGWTEAEAESGFYQSPFDGEREMDTAPLMGFAE